MQTWTGYIRRHRGLVLALALGSLLLWGWRACSSNGGDAAMGGRGGMAMAAPPVRVATALAQDVPHFLNGLGTVVPSVDVLVKSRVDGQLLRLHFQEGQRVAAGALLAEIDPRPFEAALMQAEGNLAKDQAQLDNARRDLQRYAKLAKGDFIASQQYETQRALVRQYEGIVEADKAAVASARLQVEYSRITAPVGGRLGLRNVDEGNQVKASDSNGIVRITEVSPCDVLFTLPENQVALVAPALVARERDASLAPLPVQAWDREQKTRLAVGSLLSLDNQIDSATGTVKLKARFGNENNALFPNQFVNARLMVRMLRDAVTIPAGAVQLGARGSYVYVLSPVEGGREGEGTVSLRQVRPGITTARMAVIEEGLKAGEVVVVDGLDRLRDGIRVRVAATMETPRAEAVE
ncbi:MAG: MdtA/MuxA family multidrug efflux RND transporter periplasmic adaptor subunit [Desulfovibrio sp.]|nr:MdtA/MuxA family multidrug efflux RND transporter periplasmic adaptor subunit [Desulfovibrio sp.]